MPRPYARQPTSPPTWARSLVAGELKRGIGLEDESIHNWESLSRIDPANMVTRNNGAACQLGVVGMLQSLGRPRGSSWRCPSK